MEAKSIIAPLLRWYARHKRDLPWRHGVSPYRVWLSEIMLQQTTVQAVIPYFLKFTEKYPDVRALAAAPLEDVMRDWAGLGYYSRARNLHACAKAVAASGSVFPDDLKSLPGIGDYTAGAIRAIAYGQKASVVDGNVDRVISRLFAIETPLPASKPEIRAIAERIYLSDANTDPSGLPQAFMDLGATICTPQNPKCVSCPLTGVCMAKAQNLHNELPRRASKKARPKRVGWVYWVENRGQVLIHRRPASGLLGGMAGLPTSDWNLEPEYPPHAAGFTAVADTGASVRHVFTHFELTLRIVRARVKIPAEGYYWGDPNEAGMPSLFKKVAKTIT